MTENKKRKIHPIAERALEMMISGIDTIEFDDYAVEQIQDLLKQLFGKPDLMNAVLELLNLASILDEKGCHSAAIKIITAACYAADDLTRQKK